LLEPTLFAVVKDLGSGEEQTINRIAQDLRPKAAAGPITLSIRDGQHEILNRVFGSQIKEILLELSLREIHKLRFARGPDDRAELGDFVLHVQYVAPGRTFGLSNFFQIKRVMSPSCKVPISTKQLRFWLCPTTMSYWNWDVNNTIELAKFKRYGECS
jgi:hypothetical protein